MQTYFLVRNGLLWGEKHASVRQHLNILRRYVWAARDLPRKLPRALWMISFLFERGGALAAFRLGLIDYARRRFGDCPPVVRRWTAR